jgi:hypothetical protein
VPIAQEENRADPPGLMALEIDAASVGRVRRMPDVSAPRPPGLLDQPSG